MSPQEFDDQSAAATLIAEIIGRALERVVIREVVKDRVDQLGAFTRAVSAARTSREIAHIVEIALPPILDARSVCVVDEANGGSDGGPDAVDTIRRSYPLPTVDGAVLIIEWPGTR